MFSRLYVRKFCVKANTNSRLKSSFYSRNLSSLNNKVEFQKSKNPPFEKILIANRGEIAVRIMRTCKKMGIKTVAIHSEADTNGLFVNMADESVCIGPPATRESYLQIERIVEAVKLTGSQAVHPGFGFLSENTHFAKALEDVNVVFLGPGSRAIELMGDKLSSTNIANQAKVSTIPSDNRVIKDADEAVEAAKRIGYPVMVKAAAGGGGKGMRVAYNDKECRDAFRLCTAESLSAFGNDKLFVQKFIDEPRHVEIQVLADKHGNYLYLNERECSIQRRNQKVYEEAPSPALTPQIRKAMGEQACSLAREVGYVSAGTVEFLVSDKDKTFYFLEMNTRLQVEHPVTEYITGIDLVEQMIRIGAGEKLPWKQSDIPINGWAVEARVYAEDPFRGFLPSTGTLTHYREPLKNDPNVRCDSGVREGHEISIHYDPMICKLIVHGTDRDSALTKMREALDSYVIHGTTHNIPFLRSILDHPRFIAGKLTTKFIPEEYPDGFSRESVKLSDETRNNLISLAGMVYCSLRKDSINSANNAFIYVDFDNVTYKLCINKPKDSNNDWTIVSCNNDKETSCDDNSCTVNKECNNGTEIHLKTDFKKGDYVFNNYINNEKIIAQLISSHTHDISLQYKGIKYTFKCRTENEDKYHSYMPKEVKVDLERMLFAPMPGNIYSINIKKGDKVIAGQEICIIEAMKMQNIFYAAKDGIVKGVYVKQGSSVQADQLIYELE